MQEILSVRYHQQDTDYYCGAACAQMVLDSIGAGILDQVGLYADNHAHSTLDSYTWYTGPDGLTWTLNDRRPASFSNYFVLFELTSEDLISRKIIWTIHHYKVAPVALVFGWAHWIVVRGYDASAAPSAYSDTSYSINAFYVNNPWPPTPSPAPPPPHTNTDPCGSGGTRGVANEHIAYATWQSTYMTGVPLGHWSGKFIAVCDPEPPPTDHGERRRNPRRPTGEKLLTPRRAMDAARRGLGQYGLAEHADFKKALDGAEPGEPVLVERLDRPGSYYFIVPMGRDASELSAAVGVDARYGDYMQTIALSQRGQPSHLAALDRDTVLRRLRDSPIELPEPRGHLILRDNLFCVYPALVWKPCRESLSPFYPFRMISVGEHRIYVRSDGRVFTQLHDDVRGI
jgi:hypothetical protein